MITLDQLTKIFQTPDGPVVAADHVDMHVPAGEICVLLGPSGCGKTTTLKMVNRIIPATSGRVLIDGQDTTTMDTISLRRGIGYVIQQVGLFPNMTIEENISVVPKLLGWPKSKYLARAAELLDLVALDPNAFLKRYPNELSGGQQQRVGVIRALAADPPVMLMDEPFGAIDPINREIIQDEFLKMQQALNKSILFVSHDIDEAVKMGDKIAIFDSGKLIQLDSPDKTLAMPATPFVESFVGSDRTLKRLTLAKSQSVAERNAAAIGTDDAPPEAGLRLEPLCIVDN
ncbi:MAG: ABC transporter ATP-binding protein, partial [Litorivicinus sp.]